MSQTIVVNVPHNLGTAEAKRRIQEGFGSMQQLEGNGLPGGLSFEKRWDGDEFHLQASGLGQKKLALVQEESLWTWSRSGTLALSLPTFLNVFEVIELKIFNHG